MMPSVAVLAGGLATRLRPVTEKVPKSMLEVAGRPFVDHQLRLLKAQGAESVVFCLGYLGERIQDFVGDGSPYGLRVSFSYDGEKLLGTGGALRRALPLLSDPFWILYGDSYLEAALQPPLQAWQASGLEGLMTVYRNQGRYDQSNVLFEGGRILKYDKKSRDPAMQHIDYGLGLLRRGCLDMDFPEAFDLAQLYARLVEKGQLLGYEVKERFYEIGSAEGLKETDEHLRKKAGAQ